MDDIPKLLTKVPAGVKITLIKHPEGDFMVDIPKTKQQLIDEQFAHLKGQGISISEAAQKYDVPRGAIEAWTYNAGYVNFVDEAVYPKLIDQAEVALCAQIYHQRQKNGLSGVPYFDEDDLPIVELKHPQLSEYRRRKKAV